jgi:cytoskeletal protein RodZ
MSERESAGFGSRLREARERRGVSLRQISTATKISVAVLEALERDDISRLPGGIFSRGFVRSYAAEVGLDPEQTVHDFIAAFPQDSVAAGHPAAEPVEDEESIESDRRAATTFLQLAALSVPVAAGVWFFAASGGRPAEPRQPEAAVTAEAQPSAPSPPAVAQTAPAAKVAPSEKPAPLPAQVQAPTKPAAKPALPSPSSSVATAGRTVPAASADPLAPAPPAPAAAGRFTVGLSVKRPCWISATVDGQKTIERLLRPGDERTIEVEREMVLTAGDASAVAMTINGTEARPLGKTGQVATARVNAANFRDFLTTR